MFYLFAAAVAFAWAVGGIVSGPIPRGRLTAAGRTRFSVLTPVAVGLVAAGAVVAVVALFRKVPPLDGFLDDLLARARGPALPTALVTLVNGAAEEVFFRGAVYAAAGSLRPITVSTTVYALATVATGNPALVVAAVALGLVFGWQRRSSGGVLAPVLTHLTWSAALLVLLPHVPGG